MASSSLAAAAATPLKPAFLVVEPRVAYIYECMKPGAPSETIVVVENRSSSSEIVHFKIRTFKSPWMEVTVSQPEGTLKPGARIAVKVGLWNLAEHSDDTFEVTVHAATVAAVRACAAEAKWWKEPIGVDKVVVTCVPMRNTFSSNEKANKPAFDLSVLQPPKEVKAEPAKQIKPRPQQPTRRREEVDDQVVRQFVRETSPPREERYGKFPWSAGDPVTSEALKEYSSRVTKEIGELFEENRLLLKQVQSVCQSIYAKTAFRRD